jgi:hypothetical protein
VVLAEPRRVAGRVVDGRGQPLRGVRVFSHIGRDTLLTTTHANGTFSIRLAQVANALFFNHRAYGLRLVAVDTVAEVVLARPGWLTVAPATLLWRVGWPQRDGSVLYGAWRTGWQICETAYDPGQLVVDSRSTDDTTRTFTVTIIPGDTVCLPDQR